MVNSSKIERKSPAIRFGRVTCNANQVHCLEQQSQKQVQIVTTTYVMSSCFARDQPLFMTSIIGAAKELVG